MTTAYQRKMREAHLFFEEQGRPRELLAPDGITIACRQFTPSAPIGAILISPGRAETQIKYAETLFDLAQKGYAVTILDHRGQGHSGRMLADPHPGHVKRFSDYVRDLEAVWYHIFMPQFKNLPRFLLAHSMGGLIASHFLSRNPDAAEAAILLAPLFAIHTPQIPPHLVKSIAKAACETGFGEEYAPGKGPFLPTISFEDNDWCGSPERFSHWMQQRRNHPELNLGGPTLRWLYEIHKATEDIKDKISRVKIPMLVCTTGLDTLVENRATKELFGDKEEARLVHFPLARHELLLEKDAIRDEVLALVDRFIAEHSPRIPKLQLLDGAA